MGLGMAAAAKLNSNSKVHAFNLKLQKKSHIESIFTDLMGIYSTEKKGMVSQGIYMKLDQAQLKNAEDGTVTMLMPLTGAGTFTGVLIGNEETLVEKTGKVYCEGYRHAVSTEKYGKDFLVNDAYKVYPMVEDLLSDWAKEELDLEHHQAVTETYGETLYHNDSASVCTVNWNRNVFVAGLPASTASPVYSFDSATYTSRIVQKLIDAGNGSLTPTANQILNTETLGQLKLFCIARRIKQLSLPGVSGGKGWILVVSEEAAVYMSDPSWSTKNLGALWKATAAINNDKVLQFRGVLGVYDKFLIVEDCRMNTFIPSGSGEPYSASAGYMWHGDTDRRSRDVANVRDCAYVLGEAALWLNEPEKIHYITQTDDYEKLNGVGVAGVRGIGSMNFNAETPVATTTEQFSSVLVLLGRPSPISA